MKRITPLLLLPLVGMACVSEDVPATAPALSEVQLTQLALDHDLSQPALLNHRIPISFDLVGQSDKADEVATDNVAVTFSFVESSSAARTPTSRT